MTEKLYENNSYLKEFEAIVTACIALDNCYGIELEKTAFFPEGGGQYSDTGYINDLYISDVQIIDNRILHYSKMPIEVNTKVNCKINWDRRFRNMQNHTGEHILSGVINKLYGLNNIGFHLGENDVTVDYDGTLTIAELEEAERIANEAVFKNIPVICEIPEKELLPSIPYRSKLDITENVRIVTIPGYDICACCAPHVNYTGEIGIIKIIENYRQNKHTRLRMICGSDAINYFNMLINNANGVCRLLSAQHHNFYDNTKILIDNYNESKHKLAVSNKKMALYKANQFAYTEDNILIFEEDIDTDTMRLIVNSILSKTSKIATVLSGNDTNGYNFISASTNVDLKEVASKLRTGLNGKCGGSSSMIQGHLNTTSTIITEFFK